MNQTAFDALVLYSLAAILSRVANRGPQGLREHMNLGFTLILIAALDVLAVCLTLHYWAVW